MQPEPLALVALRVQPIESPFAWTEENYFVTNPIQFFPEGKNPTISFTVTRYSKVFGYIPFVGSIIGLDRIYNAYQEYRLFSATHLHFLSQRSIKWMIRGALEIIPILGGLILMIVDLIATLLYRSNHEALQLPDDTNYGSPCGLCKR